MKNNISYSCIGEAKNSSRFTRKHDVFKSILMRSVSHKIITVKNINCITAQETSSANLYRVELALDKLDI